MDPARAAVERHADTINTRSVQAYRRTMHYPFTYQNYNGVALTIERPEDCGVTEDYPWDIILRTDPGWSYTDFEAVEELARSVSSAVFKVSFRRVDRSGAASNLYDAIWIATYRDDRWAIQFRHNLGQRVPSP